MTEPKSADDIRADIEATRAELAETADALAAKLDVKAQASAKVHAAQDSLVEHKERTALVGGAAAAVVAALVVLRVRRRRK